MAHPVRNKAMEARAPSVKICESDQEVQGNRTGLLRPRPAWKYEETVKTADRRRVVVIGAGIGRCQVTKDRNVDSTT
jgi:hypothetical protein